MQPNLAANDAERQRKIASLAVGGLACLLAIYHLKLLPLLLMVGLGCIVGYALASPDVLSASSRRYSTDNLNRFTQMMREASTESLEETNRRVDRMTTVLRRHVRHPGLQQCFNLLADCIIKDFVDFWYVGMLRSSPAAGLLPKGQLITAQSTAANDFKRFLHCSLVGSFINLYNTLQVLRRRDIDVEISNLITFGIANVFIVHMREYRQNSTARNTSRPRSTSRHGPQEFMRRVSQISEKLVKRILPTKDAQSTALCSFVGEIVANFILVPIIVKLSAPSFINSTIISTLVATSDSNQLPLPSPTTARRKSKNLQFNGNSIGDDDEELIDPESLTIADILQRNDLFALLMEFMESIRSPPYLRFWTNADIYRQFAQLATKELASLKQDSVAKVQTLEALRADALAVFNAHFSVISDFPILLCTPMLLASTVDYQDILSETFEEEALLQHRELVRAIQNEIERSPSAECFVAAQKSVLKILECEFEQMFKQSALFRRYFGLPVDDNDDELVASQEESTESLLTDTDSVDISHLHRLSSQTFISGDGTRMVDSIPSPAAVTSTRSPSAAISARDEEPIGAEDESKDMDISVQSLSVDNAVATAGPSASSIANKRNSGKPKKLADDAIAHVAAALTSLREQKMLVSSSINRLRAATKGSLSLEASAKLRRMKKTVKELDMQIQQMTSMATDMDSFSPQNASMQQQQQSNRHTAKSAGTEIDSADDGRTGDQLIDLRGIKVQLTDMGANEETAELSSTLSNTVSVNSSTAPSPANTAASGTLFSTISRKLSSTISGSSSLTNYVRSMLIGIEIERSTSPQSSTASSPADNKVILLGSTGWVVSRRLTDFQALHATLSTQFPKVAKIPFPAVPPKSSSLLASSAAVLASLGSDHSAHTAASADFESRKSKFLKDLTNLLQILLADQLLCETKAMQLFLRPDNYTALLQQSKAAAAAAASSKAPMDLQSLQTLLRQRMAKLLKQTRLPAMLVFPQSSDRKGFDLFAASVKSSSSSLDDSTAAEPSVDEYGSTKGLSPAAASSRNTTVDLDLYIDTFFGLLTELFDLQQRNQWLRRKALSVMRQYLLQQSRRGQGRIYTQMVARVTGFFEAIFGTPPSTAELNAIPKDEETHSDDALHGMVSWLVDWFWSPPDREWQVVAPMSEQELERQQSIHENQEKEARSLFLAVFGEHTQSGALEDSFVGEVGMMLNRMVGRYNTAVGCQRLFEMVQNEDLNRNLVLSIFECVTNIALSEDRRVI